MAVFCEKTEILTANDRLQQIFTDAWSNCGRPHWPAIRTWSTLSPRDDIPVFIAMEADDANRIGQQLQNIEKTKTLLLFEGSLPLNNILDSIFTICFQITKTGKRFHFIYSSNSDGFANRLITVLGGDDYKNIILDARWESDKLLVVYPADDGFNKLFISLEKLPALRNCNQQDLHNFQIDEEGLFIYWPTVDVHMGFEQFQQAVDEKAYLKAKQQSDRFNRAYGAAIRTLRESQNLRQVDINGLDSRQIRRIEKGQCRATSNALELLAAAHNMSVSDYMNTLSKLLQ